MYKTFLILKYLRKRRIAWVSLMAVVLCTTMVIVVMSVMGGWLSMFRESQRGLIGDVIITRRSWSGFPYYQEIIDELKAKVPEVKAAVPAIQTFGLININNAIRSGVQVYGYPIDQIGEVNAFPQSLYRQRRAATDPHLSAADRALAQAAATQPASFDPPLAPELYRFIKSESKSDPAKWPGMIVGDGVVGVRKRDDGTIGSRDGLLRAWAQLTLVGIDDEGSQSDLINQKAMPTFWIVDNSRTKFYQQDENTVYVDFSLLQRELRMGEDEYTDAKTGEKVKVPARTSNIQISVKPGFKPADVTNKVREVAAGVMLRHNYDMITHDIYVNTWEEMQADFINAIEHEIVLTTLLFAIISIVAVFLIFCIFYMIVVEKTRDVGIIKSVGATSSGVAGIFLGYGLAIGLIGGGLGLLVSYVIVHNINELHAALGKYLGIEMWNAKTYMFDSIPNTLDPKKVAIIVSVAVISSVVGSLIPAIRAARMNPVEALRWE